MCILCAVLLNVWDSLNTVYAHSKYLQKYLCLRSPHFPSFYSHTPHGIGEWRQSKKHTIIMTSRCDRTNIYLQKKRSKSKKKIQHTEAKNYFAWILRQCYGRKCSKSVKKIEWNERLKMGNKSAAFCLYFYRRITNLKKICRWRLFQQFRFYPLAIKFCSIINKWLWFGLVSLPNSWTTYSVSDMDMILR